MKTGTHQELDFAGEVIGLAMNVHRTLGPGLLENVYANALEIELRLAGIPYVREKKLSVNYRGEIVGDFSCDFFLEAPLILELKAVSTHTTGHELQLVNYLAGTGVEEGLLFNFGGPSLEFKKKFRTFRNSDPDSCNGFHEGKTARLSIYRINKISEEPEAIKETLSSICPPNSGASAPLSSYDYVNGKPGRCFASVAAVNSVKNAFTLLELLVAMAVLSLLVVMMMGLVDSAAKLWRDSENRVDAYREARAALGIIARDLQNAVATTNTNYFLINGQGAFAKVPSGSQTNENRASAAYFLSALPANAQEDTKNKSDVCEVGYFMAFERARNATNSTMTLNIFRHFRSSDTTFKNLTNSTLFADSAVGIAGEELLARNIREFRITPLTITNNTFVPFTATTNKPLPDLIEVSITAVNQEAAKRFTSSTDWTSTTPPFALTNAQQTFTTRIRINRP